MKNIIEKYNPLNTEEKITSLFEELKSKGCFYSAELEIAILYEIRKAKLQVFLKDILKQLPKKTYSPGILPNIKVRKKEYISEENVLVPIPTKKINNYHIDSNFKKDREKILKKRTEQKTKEKRPETRPIQKKTYPCFSSKEEVDAYINAGRITSIHDARDFLEHAGSITIDRNVYIYLRRCLNDLIEEIKMKHFSGGYEKMKRQQDLEKESLNKGPTAKIMYIPAGGQNKKY